MVNVDELINDWNEIKSRISYYEQKLEKLKGVIHHELDKRDSLQNNKYEVYRKKIVRKSITKKNVPSHIWNEYAVESKPYYQLYVHKIKN